MTLLQRLSLAAVAALVPLGAAAEMPNVTGIRAVERDGTVVVSWNKVDGDVKAYRVFYSHASILEQGGVYDDYEDAAGDVSEHALSAVPPVQTLYVSVLAVGHDDTESPFFMEEAFVRLSGQPAATPAKSENEAGSPTVPVQSATLQFLSAVSTSATGVTLTFSHPLSIPEEYKLQAFAIKDGSGAALGIARYRLEGNTAVLDTGVQRPGTVYQATIHASIAGKTPGGTVVPQDAATSPLLFTGNATDASAPEVGGLKLAAKGRTVEATWTLPAATIRELRIEQSIDGGRTFGAPARLDKSAKGVAIPNVTAARFTLLVRTVGLDGSVSRGAAQTITLAGGGQSSSKASSSSKSSSSASSKPATPGQKPGTLPNSGLGLGAIVALSGAATSMRFLRRKNAAKA